MYPARTRLKTEKCQRSLGGLCLRSRPSLVTSRNHHRHHSSRLHLRPVQRDLFPSSIPCRTLSLFNLEGAAQPGQVDSPLSKGNHSADPSLTGGWHPNGELITPASLLALSFLLTPPSTSHCPPLPHPSQPPPTVT